LPLVVGVLSGYDHSVLLPLVLGVITQGDNLKCNSAFYLHFIEHGHNRKGVFIVHEDVYCQSLWFVWRSCVDSFELKSHHISK